ncbi:hypothetical protein [Defluviimonas salinarum]|uniref:Uncharacterized protein n=1 Tax=Defluviimonas salinarum TaxID=2992147 RepID=A0ABT3J4F7_9RHOB|nr:hypothetical protein [Defluviimonas salinarum]MCW3782550.1 hypothetical protein [Defluviimonas salinarum]
MQKITLTLIAALLGGATYAGEATSDTGAAAPALEAAALSAPGAAAPEAFTAIPGITPAGRIGGMDAWTTGAAPFLWMTDPDSGRMFAGFVFDRDGRSLHPDHAGDDAMTVAALIAETFGANAIPIPEEYAPDIEAMLARLDAATRQEATRKLVEAVRLVTDEAGFQAAISGWLEEVSSMLPDAAADPAVNQGAAAVSGDEASAESGASLHEALQGASWLAIGAADAPVVYAITDPSCDACRAAIASLRPEIEAGRLQLRLVMIPAVDADSAGTIAGILLAVDPKAAVFDLSRVENPVFPLRRVSDLDEDQRQALDGNLALARRYQLPSVPFFAFRTSEGEKYIAGAPTAEQIAGALPDLPSAVDDTGGETAASANEDGVKDGAAE